MSHPCIKRYGMRRGGTPATLSGVARPFVATFRRPDLTATEAWAGRQHQGARRVRWSWWRPLGWVVERELSNGARSVEWYARPKR
jgi:hypothetical protein